MPQRKNNMSENLLKRIAELENEQQKRLLLERQLEDSTERLESLLNKLPLGIVIIDFDTQIILDVNPYALSTFDCSPEQLIGKKCTDHICPAQGGNCPILDQGLELDRSEREIITFTGERIPVLKTVMKNEIDEKAVLLECFIDIRDKKRAEEEYIKRQKLEAVLEITGAVCHEFNQPLQIINGYCELLKTDPGSTDESRHQINKIMEAVSKMGSLTRDLMNMADYETKPYLKSRIVDIKRSSCKQQGIEPFE